VALRSLFVYPRFPAKLDRLFDLAYNLWTFWDDEALKLFERIDLSTFRLVGRSPIEFLHSLSRERLDELAKDAAFLRALDRLWRRYGESMQPAVTPRIAYFSMEFGLPKLPIYAGGLGMLAGDHLKGASDIGLPIVGVGIYYRFGYFIQRINVEGKQEEVYREINPHYTPIQEWKTAGDQSVFVTINLAGQPVRLKVWRVQVGRVSLLLLDANVPENPPELRSITNYLYDADRDRRIMQEIVLGQAGLRALEAVGIQPEIYHLNEGHSAFLILERLRRLIKERGYSYEEACAVVKCTTVFTTHTPVEAGNENFPVEMLRKYLADDVEALGVTWDAFVEHGLLHDRNTFWLPAFAIRFARHINGVSQLHAGVSRRMWSQVFPGHREHEIPVEAITNGVHASWMAPEIADLVHAYVGDDVMRSAPDEKARDRIMEIPELELWDAHMKCKRRMISYLRSVFTANWIERGYSPAKVRRAREMLNAGFLTIGFARRFATYKRADLILRDRERLARILKNERRPIQILFAGKAHPADVMAKKIITDIFDFARDYGLEDRIYFVENYARSVAEHLVQGCDLWLNNPIRPNEASGTSGMKAGINGVLNLSVLDGWWPECFNGANGWAITAGDYYDNPDMRDAAESNQIYDYLEGEVADLFYDRGESDVPAGWVTRMKESIYTVSRGFSITRMLTDYQQRFYAPALQMAERLQQDHGGAVKDVVTRASRLNAHWDKIEFRAVESGLDKRKTAFAEDPVPFTCYVFLDGLDAKEVAVELFYWRQRDDKTETVRLELKESYKDQTARYEGELTLRTHGLQEIDARMVPADPEVRQLYPSLVKWAP
jgi:glycogen phosphorylase